ncbi:MAG TPA: hypothetical protein VGO58_02040 [Chitinophagaceae bacterium]|jgi:sugar lactone lactonase YvrE|nr:hypothetical protein [Chitinophagaceae bacterium]
MKYLLYLAVLLSSQLSAAQTERINFKLNEFYPEGIASNSKTNSFFIGSVKTGTIVTVDMNGEAKIFYEDRSLKSSFGMKVDTMRNLLWVCTGDPNYSVYADPATHKKSIHIVTLDLDNGKKIQDHDLSGLYAGKHFANDLTLDNAGNVYITDSYSPVIYRIDSKGKIGVWAESELFRGLDIGLNGITWHPGGFLIAVNNGNGSILKIATDVPNKAEIVKVSNFFPGADGLLINAEGHLVLVQNKGVNKVFELGSADNWKSASIVKATASADMFHQPSTCAQQQGKIYVVNSKLNELQDPGITPSKEFSLQVAVLRPVQ